MGPILRALGTWVAATALIVLAVDAAIGRVAEDVSVARPAPMTASEVDDLLDERQGDAPGRLAGTTSLSEPTNPATSAPTTDTTSSAQRPPATPPSSASTRPETPRPTLPSGPPVGTSTTIERGTAGQPDGRDNSSRP